MIDQKRAEELLREKYPNFTIVKRLELPRHWLFMVKRSSNGADYDDPFYAVKKSSGAVSSYSPLDDIDNFNKAMIKMR